jgi:hypothetical protein
MYLSQLAQRDYLNQFDWLIYIKLKIIMLINYVD